MSRPSELPVLSLLELVGALVMASSADEMYRTVRVQLRSKIAISSGVSDVVPPRMFDALGRHPSLGGLFAAKWREINNQTGVR